MNKLQCHISGPFYDVDVRYFFTHVFENLVPTSAALGGYGTFREWGLARGSRAGVSGEWAS